MAKLTRQAALKAAINNAAGLISDMDLEQLFGSELSDQALENDQADLLTEAQQEIVAAILRARLK